MQTAKRRRSGERSVRGLDRMEDIAELDGAIRREIPSRRVEIEEFAVSHDSLFSGVTLALY